MKVLVTCLPMLGMIDDFRPIFTRCNVGLMVCDVVQTLSTDQLKELVPRHDGCIIGGGDESDCL